MIADAHAFKLRYVDKTFRIRSKEEGAKKFNETPDYLDQLLETVKLIRKQPNAKLDDFILTRRKMTGAAVEILRARLRRQKRQALERCLEEVEEIKVNAHAFLSSNTHFLAKVGGATCASRENSGSKNFIPSQQRLAPPDFDDDGPPVIDPPPKVPLSAEASVAAELKRMKLVNKRTRPATAPAARESKYADNLSQNIKPRLSLALQLSKTTTAATSLLQEELNARMAITSYHKQVITTTRPASVPNSIYPYPILETPPTETRKMIIPSRPHKATKITAVRPSPIPEFFVDSATPHRHKTQSELWDAVEMEAEGADAYLRYPTTRRAMVSKRPKTASEAQKLFNAPTPRQRPKTVGVVMIKAELQRNVSCSSVQVMDGDSLMRRAVEIVFKDSLECLQKNHEAQKLLSLESKRKEKLATSVWASETHGSA